MVLPVFVRVLGSDGGGDGASNSSDQRRHSMKIVHATSVVDAQTRRQKGRQVLITGREMKQGKKLKTNENEYKSD